MFLIIGLLLFYTFFLACILGLLLTYRLFWRFKKGIKLRGEIVRVFKTGDGKRYIPYLRPRVKVTIDGEEHILQGIANNPGYEKNDIVDVYYNKSMYSDLVYIDVKKNKILNNILAVYCILASVFLFVVFINKDLIEGLQKICNGYELIVLIILYGVLIIPAYKMAKWSFNRLYFNEANDEYEDHVEGKVTKADVNRYSDITDKLFECFLQGNRDESIIQEAHEAIDILKDYNEHYIVYSNLVIYLLDLYIAQKDYGAAYELIESVDIYKVRRPKYGEYNWLEVVLILDRKMKIYKEICDKNKMSELVTEGKPLMKQAEKYFKKNNPGTVVDEHIKHFYDECSLFEKDYEGA